MKYLSTSKYARLKNVNPKDLFDEFPAVAARDMGWKTVPLLCSHEMEVPSGLKKCIRILILWNTKKPQKKIN